MRSRAIQDSFLKPEALVWSTLAIGILVLSKFESFNQVVLKGLVPVLLLITIAREQKIILVNKQLLFYVILTGWALLSLFYTVNLPMTVDYLQIMVGNIILWYIIDRSVRRINSLTVLLIPLLLSFAVQLYFGLTMDTSVVYSINDRDVAQITGLLGNPNALAFFLWYGVTSSILLFLTLEGRLQKVVVFVFAGLLLYAIFNTGSRKTLAATLIFASTVVLLKSRKRVHTLLILLFSYFLYDMVSGYIIENTTVGARLGGDHLESGFEKREFLISEGISFFKSNPLIGIGLGSFTTYSSIQKMSHNDFIEILSTMGLPGLIIYCLIFVDYFKKSWKVLPFRDNTTIVCIGFLAGYIFLGMGRPAFLDPISIFMFAFFQAVLLKTIHERQRTPAQNFILI